MSTRSLVINIAGQRYVVRSDADQAYLKSLAEYVDQQISEVKQTSKPVAPHRHAILAALNIADELFQERLQRKVLKQKVKRQSVAIMDALDREIERRTGEGAGTP